MTATTLPHELQRQLGRAAGRVGPFVRIEWHREVGSTNDLALRHADAGAPEGLVVLADTQTAGRGRLGRQWISPPGAGIYMSALLRPPRLTPLLTLAAGVAAAEGIATATGLQPALKWPNDICVVPSQGGPRKIGGILAEARAGAGEAASALVVGTGINVEAAAFPRELAGVASSLEHELGRLIDRELLVVELLASLWRRYSDVRDGRSAGVLAAWRERATATFGRRVEWQMDHRTLTGLIEDVDEEGALIIRANHGSVRLVSGEVRWIS